MRYQLEFPPNPDVMIIHVDKVLTNRMNEGYYVGGNHPKAPAFVKELMGVDGVTGDVYMNRYEVHIQRAGLFEWAPIVEQVVEILRKHFDPEGQAEEVAPPYRWYATRSRDDFFDDFDRF